MFAIDANNNVLDVKFQVTDRITRNLAAVAKVCQRGRACYFSPSPNFEAYILHDPSKVCLGSGVKTRVNLKRGVYEFKLRELVKEPHGALRSPTEPGAKPQFLCANDAASSSAAAAAVPLAPARDDPYTEVHDPTEVSIIPDDEVESGELESGETESREACQDIIDAPAESALVRTLPNPLL